MHHPSPPRLPAPSNLDPRGGVVVITGAAGGIGAALAPPLADRGCHLVPSPDAPVARPGRH